MSLDTFANLKTEIASWLRRSDLTTEIPTFITLAEAQMNQRLRVPAMMTTSTVSITAETLALPADYLVATTLRLTSGSGRLLSAISEDQAQGYKAGTLSATGEPKAFTVRGGYFEFTPAPDTTYSALLSYFQKIPALSDSSTSNWVLASFPQAYLYGALMQSAPYLRSDERLATWGALFETALDDIRTSARQVQSPTLGVEPGLRTRPRFNITIGDC